MKFTKTMIVAAGLVALAACNKQTPADNAADNMTASTDNAADSMKAAADNKADAMKNESH